MKKVKYLIGIVLSFVVVFLAVTGINAASNLTDAEKVTNEINNVKLPTEVISSFNVPYKSVFGSTITWSSNDSAVIDASYVNESNGWVLVTRSESEDKSATLTLTITLNEESKTKDFEISVPKGVTHSPAYTITFVDEVQTAPEAMEYTVGTKEALPAIENTTNKDFLGWYNGNKVVTSTLGLVGNVTLTARYATVTGITVTGNVIHEYEAKEEFDTTGMIVSKTYDLKDPVVTEDYTVIYDDTVNNVLHVNDIKVVVSCLGFTKNVDVVVSPLTPTVYVNCNQEGLTYGMDLPELSLSEESTEGVVVWDANQTLLTGTHSYTYSFAAEDEDYDDATGSVELIVSKATPSVNAIVDEGDLFVGGVFPEISSNNASGTIAWDANQSLTAGTNAYAWTWTPTDKDNYNEVTGTVNLTVSNKEMTGIVVDTKPTTLTYTALEAFDVTGMVVKATYNDGSDSALNNEDLTVTYQNGEAFHFGDTKVTLTYGDFTAEVTVTVSKKVLAISASNVSVIYDGTDHSIALDEVEGVTFSYSENNTLTNVGSVEVTISMTYGNDYTGDASITATLAVTAKPILVLVDSATFTYGTDVEIDFIADDVVGEDTLNIAFSWGENTNVGTYPMTVSGDNSNYEVSFDEDSVTNVTITAKALSDEDITVEAVADQTYTGSAIEPKVVVKYGTVTLVEGTDYVLAYLNNTAVGEATIQVNYKEGSNYVDAKVVKFNIVKTDAERVQDAKAYITTELESFVVSEEATLPVAKDGVTFTYTSDSTGLSVNADGTLNIIQNEEAYEVNLTVTISLNDENDAMVVTVTVPAKAEETPQEAEFTYDFTKIEGFNWSSSYEKHTVESTGITSSEVLAACTFNWSAASKQGTNIKDQPVSKAGTLTVTLTDSVYTEITSVSFTLTQWTTKSINATIEYSLDGTNWVTCSDLITTPGVVSMNIDALPAGVTTVRFYQTLDKNQFGYASCTLTVK